MTRQALAVLLLAASAGLTQAAETSHIQADKMVLQGAEGVTVFSGHVHFSQPDPAISILADQVTILRQDSKVVRVEASGKPVRFRHEGRKQPIRGEARELLYIAARDRLTLSGDAEVQTGKDLIRGQHIEYNLATRQAVASGGTGSDGRFEAVLNPGEGKTGDKQTK